MYRVLHKAKEAKEIPLDQIVPNEYNPNVMPSKEMVLLGACILKYGFLFPVLVFWNPELEKYQIIDGYHRWKTLLDLSNKKSKLFKAVCKHLEIAGSDVLVNTTASCIVLDVTIEEAIQLTILMNRIKGAHKVSGMSNTVSLLTETMEDTKIALNLGMGGEEFIRLKAQKGERVVAEKFKNHKPGKSWEIR